MISATSTSIIKMLVTLPLALGSYVATPSELWPAAQPSSTLPLVRSVYTERSPENLQTITMYEFNYEPNTQYPDADYPLRYQNIFGLKKVDNVSYEHYIFIGPDSTGYPHWLGNQYVFFNSQCGSSCEIINLLNVDSQELRQGMYSCRQVGTTWETIFTDWFGHDWVFPGLLDTVSSQTINGKNYLLLNVDRDEQGNIKYQKRFLFTGNRLEEQ